MNEGYGSKRAVDDYELIRSKHVVDAIFINVKM
jgi:hypothetical protein